MPIIDGKEVQTISLKEADPIRGDCKRCKKDSHCNGFWKHNVEKGATCLMRGNPNYPWGYLLAHDD